VTLTIAVAKTVGRATALGAALLLGAGGAAAQEAKKDWQPAPPMPDAFDWIQLDSDEWLKGEIKAMYRESLEFDSDKLENLSFDFADVRKIRSAATMQVGLVDGRLVRGKLVVDGDKVMVIGDRTVEVDRSQVMSITPGEPKERSYWSGKVGAGANFRRGNTDQLETNAVVGLKRRTARNRISLDYLGNYSVTEEVTVSDNHRATGGWDHFVSDRFFLRPVQFEYFRDPFQNIAHRYTVGSAVGYQLVDSSKIEWEVSAGAAYQNVGFDDVVAGEPDSANTAALTVASVYDHELSDSVDLTVSYKFFLVDEESGQYTHSFLTGLSFDLIDSLDFDVTFVWDRIEKPRPSSDGTVPKKDDYRLNFALSFDF
jgi:putative salt-induced outer membrane protein YdiY